MPNLDGSLTWKELFEKKIAQVIWENGGPIRDNADSYGWMDYHLVNHQQRCSMATYSDLQEDQWDEFDGTDVGNSYHYGASMEMTCACGVIKGRIRLDMPLGEVLYEIWNTD